MDIETIVLLAGGTLTGLFAGLLYAFSVAVVPALRALKGTQHIAAMQSINVKILNPLFLLSFLGPAILLPLAAFLHRGRAPFGFLLTAALLYILGAIGVTVAGNVPLNDKLARIDVAQLSEADADRIRREFQGPGAPWMRFHAARTLSATAATILIFLASLTR